MPSVTSSTLVMDTSLGVVAIKSNAQSRHTPGPNRRAILPLVDMRVPGDAELARRTHESESACADARDFEVDTPLTTPLFRRVDCLSIPVPDLDAALTFYCENLGHALIWRTIKSAGLSLPGSTAELVLHTDARPMETDLV